MKTFIAAVAALFIGSSASVALAEGHGHGGGEIPGLHMLLKTANLTADQQTQVHQLMRNSWTQNKALHAQMRALREQIADKLAETGTVTAADITGLQQQIAQLRTQLDQRSVQTAIQVRGLLTSDQLRQVAQAHVQLKNLRAQMKAVVPEQAEDVVAPERFQAPALQQAPVQP